ncbi:MAG: hypothetical protein IPF41_07045 [Flavobacteriales bacterium]|nr:hypothetical protein [Flavobacteriales bacterium]
MKHLSALLFTLLFAPALFAAQGGPDAYGYIWKDSNEPDGPVFSWIDITTTGQMIMGLGDDNVVGPIVMETDMPFYWYARKNLWIGSNGYVAFNGGNLASPFPLIPTSGGVNDYVAGMASDLNFLGTGNPGRCYLLDTGDTTIISWIDVPFWSPTAPTYTGSNTFQIILNKLDSSITVQYLTQTGLTQNTDLKLGIESVAGSIGLQHSSNVYPVTGIAIRYYMPPSSTLQILDATVGYNGQPGSNGVFRSRNGAPFQMIANALNVGNTDTGPFSFAGALLNSVGATQITATQPIGNIVPGLDTTVIFAPTWVPNPAGTYRFNTTVSGLTGELVTLNNAQTQEIVVVDTTTATQDLRYHGLTDNGVGLSWNGGNGGVGMYIKPPYYPAYATHTTVRIVSNTGLTGYTMKVYDDDAPGGLPGTLLDSVNIPAAQAIAGDQVIALTAPITITSGGVYVQWYMLSANINIAVDITPPFSLNSYEVIDGVWAEYRDRTIQDFFIGLRLGQVPVFDAGCNGFFNLVDGQAIGSPTAIRPWIRNYGNQVVTSLDVHYRFGNGNVVTQAYSGPAINPGAQQLFTFSSSYTPAADETGSLCAWTTLPNDAVTANDTSCVLVNTYVGIPENALNAVVIGPVPADQELRLLGLPAGTYGIVITDAAGRTVSELSAAHGGALALPTHDLPAGAYQLVLTDESVRRAFGFVVQH